MGRVRRTQQKGKVAELAKNNPDALAKAAYKTQHTVKIDKREFVTVKNNNNNDKMPVKMNPAEALSLKIQCDLSDDQYQLIRNNSLIHNADIYPTLHALLKEKNKCYPLGLNITETQALCPLQNMVDHTLERIVQVPEAQEKLQNATSTDDNSTGTLHCKIGFDGASSQSVYKQKYEETELTDAKKN